MRHSIAGNKLGRNVSLRYVTVRDIAKAALVHQRVCTTKAKAKEARKLVEKLITMGKKGTLAHRRRAFAILCDHKLVSELFTKTSPLFKNRIGGYTRIISLGNRRGDNAQLAYLELTEKTEVIVSKPKSKAVSKKDVIDTTAQETAAPIAEPKVEAKELPKPKMVKEEPDKQQIKEDTGLLKNKPGKGIMGGFRKMFTKKPSNG